MVREALHRRIVLARRGLRARPRCERGFDGGERVEGPRARTGAARAVGRLAVAGLALAVGGACRWGLDDYRPPSENPPLDAGGGSGAPGDGGGANAMGAGGVGGTPSDAGQAGDGGAGDAGRQGAGGAGGSLPSACDGAKGEFELPSAPLACFFFLNASAKAQPISQRVEWTWSQASDDCAQLSAHLASPSTLTQWRELSALIKAGFVPVADLTVGESVWVGARTNLETPADASELAGSFVWPDGDAWAFVQPGAEPWGPNEPSLDGGSEQCVEMRRTEYNLNNRACDTLRTFALCERAR
jgi:Lectin C-type domain